jgi:hypothetical protein
MLTTGCFDLWMSKGAYDIFCLVINFLNENWEPKKLTISLFKATETTSQALTRNLRKLLDSYRLNKKINVYVKDEGENFNSMTRVVKFVVNSEVLGLEESFNGIVLIRHFPKLVSMLLLKRGYEKILSMSQSSLRSLTFRSV